MKSLKSGSWPVPSKKATHYPTRPSCQIVEVTMLSTWIKIQHEGDFVILISIYMLNQQSKDWLLDWLKANN